MRNNWFVQIDNVHFDKLRTEEGFWQLVALSRAVNALRFVHTALLGHDPEDDSVRAQRTRFNSFFFTCALLYEALLLVQRLSKHYRDVPEFAKLRQILKEPVAMELRNSGLASVRNRLTFHFDEREIGAQLAKTDMPKFAAGQGGTNADVYYELADSCALGAFSGFSLGEPGALDKLAKRIAEATDLALRFMNAAEGFIVAVLKAQGWERIDAPTTA